MKDNRGRPERSELDNEITVRIGKEIKRARKLKKISQVQLSKLMKVSVDSVRNWEQGKFKPANRDDYDKLKEILDVDVRPVIVESKMIINSSKEILDSVTKDDKKELLERLLLKMGYFPDSLDPNFTPYMMKRLSDAMEDYKLLHGDTTVNPYQFNMTMERYGVDISIPENPKRNSTNITSADHIRRELEFQESNRKDDEE